MKTVEQYLTEAKLSRLNQYRAGIRHQYTLQDAVIDNQPLVANDYAETELDKDLEFADTLDDLISLLSYRCSLSTKNTLRRCLRYPASLGGYGIFERVQLLPDVRYCAGQSYSDEIRNVRELIINN